MYMYLQIASILLSIVALVYVYTQYASIESFSNFSATNTVKDALLLTDVYTVKKDAGLSHYSRIAASNKKVFVPFSSFEQRTNNQRYWETPDNESCLRTELCHGLYEPAYFTESTPLSPSPFTDEMGTRVNMYHQ